MQFVLDPRETVIIAILVLFAGKFLNARVGVLQRFNIPEPVTGGLLAALLFGVLNLLAGVVVEFSLGPRDTLLIVFFTCIGLSARISTLLAGGRALLLLLLLAVGVLFIQNLIGVAVAALMQFEPVAGLLGGSISLSGGHGTAIAWAPTFVEQFGIEHALELGVTCATFGLILGGVVGGPIARYLINRHRLQSTSSEHLVVGQPLDQPNEIISTQSVLSTLLVISIAITLGLYLNELLQSVGLRLPTFVTCLFAGIVLTNTVPLLFRRLVWPTGTPTLALASDLSLGLFLTMSLMSLQLWTLFELAGPILLLLTLQVAAVVAFAIWVLYPAMGRNYDAAVIAAGYTGMALGATPTAMANMTAVTEKHGPSPKAFLVVPLVGAFFIDLANAFVIELTLSLFR